MSSLQRQDFEELEAPRYLEHLDLPTDTQPDQTSALDLVQTMWTGKLGLVDKSLEELEAEDLVSRQRLTTHTEGKEKQREQLATQQNIHTLLIGAVLTARRALDLAKELPEIDRSSWVDLQKDSLKCQKQIAKAKVKVGKLSKTLLKNHSRQWQWYESLCQEWTLRAGLATGLSLLSQAEKEADLKQGVWEDSELLRALARELKMDESGLLRKTNKKPKHRLSKHRKLKFDVHEKLLNFMAPQVTMHDPRSEKILNSLFGRTTDEPQEQVFLDIPLI